MTVISFPWRTQSGWHQAGCTRAEGDTIVEDYGPWVYLSMRPHDENLYPALHSAR